MALKYPLKVRFRLFVFLKGGKMETQKTQIKEHKIPCEVYSRVVGYLRPVRNWNNGKKQEFSERITFKVKQTQD